MDEEKDPLIIQVGGVEMYFYRSDLVSKMPAQIEQYVVVRLDGQPDPEYLPLEKLRPMAPRSRNGKVYGQVRAFSERKAKSLMSTPNPVVTETRFASRL